MRENRLHAMPEAGEPTLGTRIHSPWPAVRERVNAA
jgi:hypothetical protein